MKVLFPLVAFFERRFRKAALRCDHFHSDRCGDRIMGSRLTLLVLKRRFDTAIRLGTPDTIDLLVVCSEAGWVWRAG